MKVKNHNMEKSTISYGELSGNSEESCIKHTDPLHFILNGIC